MTVRRMTDEELAAEANRWPSREPDDRGWKDAPEAVPRQGESVAISLRVPKKMLEIIRELARRQGIGYQVLMKRWLDDRIRLEAEQLRERPRTIALHQPDIVRKAASFEATAEIELKVSPRAGGKR